MKQGPTGGNCRPKSNVDSVKFSSKQNLFDLPWIRIGNSTDVERALDRCSSQELVGKSLAREEDKEKEKRREKIFVRWDNLKKPKDFDYKFKTIKDAWV